MICLREDNGSSGEIACVVRVLRSFYGDDEAVAWMNTALRLLGGDTPSQRIRDGKPRDVWALIEQLRTEAVV